MKTKTCRSLPPITERNQRNQAIKTTTACVGQVTEWQVQAIALGQYASRVPPSSVHIAAGPRKCGDWSLGFEQEAVPVPESKTVKKNICGSLNGQFSLRSTRPTLNAHNHCCGMCYSQTGLKSAPIRRVADSNT